MTKLQSFFGGCIREIITADYTIGIHFPRNLFFASSTPSLTVILPDPTNLGPEYGGRCWFFCNVGTESIDVDRHDSSLLDTFPTNRASMITLARMPGGELRFFRRPKAELHHIGNP